jgi:hypothetical protein
MQARAAARCTLASTRGREKHEYQARFPGRRLIALAISGDRSGADITTLGHYPRTSPHSIVALQSCQFRCAVQYPEHRPVPA